MPHAEGCRTFTLEHMKKEAPQTTTCCTTVEKEDSCEKAVLVEHGQNRWGYFLVWLIVIWIIVAAILWIFQPDFLNEGFGCGKRSKRCERERSRSCSRDRDDCFNFGRLALWSFIIALVIVFLIWLFRAYGGGYRHGALAY